MSIIYIISIVMLIIASILIKKNDSKLDFIKTLTVKLVLFLCYQTFICYICSMLHIPITLITLTIINVIVIAILIRKIIKEKNIQKYKFIKKDLIFIVLLLVVVGVITYFDFGIPFNIKYIMTDASVHYISAKEFYENESLLLNVDNIETSNAMMPGAYTNIGILFKVFSPYIGEMNLYKVFIGFDIFVLFLSGLLFFETIKKYSKTLLSYFLAGVISIIYLLGYPLNNLLFGYFYLGIGVLIINAILLILQEFPENTEKHYSLITLFLLCFELFFSYYLFVPAIYGAIFIFYVVYFKKKHGKLVNISVICFTLVTLVIPTILGFVYHVLPGLLSNNQIQVTNLIKVEGYIYRNLYSNLLLFIPFVVYYFLKEPKEKRINFDIFALIIFVIYMCILYISIFELHISTYYFFKTYFVLWQFVIYLFYRGICFFIEERKIGKYIVSVYVGLYIFLMIYSFFFNKVEITKETFNANEKVTDVMDIYGINKTVLLNEAKDYTTNELEILKYAKDNNLKFENKNTLILANQRQEFWFWAILGYRFKVNLEYSTTINDIEAWNNGEYEYLIYFNRSNNFKNFYNMLNLETQVVFENESGAILKYY